MRASPPKATSKGSEFPIFGSIQAGPEGHLWTRLGDQGKWQNSYIKENIVFWTSFVKIPLSWFLLYLNSVLWLSHCFSWRIYLKRKTENYLGFSGGAPCKEEVKWSEAKWKRLSLVWLFETPWTVHGILQVIILEWKTFPFSRGSSQPRDRTQVSSTAGRFFTSWATKEALIKLKNKQKTIVEDSVCL